MKAVINRVGEAEHHVTDREYEIMIEVVKEVAEITIQDPAIITQAAITVIETRVEVTEKEIEVHAITRMIEIERKDLHRLPTLKAIMKILEAKNSII